MSFSDLEVSTYTPEMDLEETENWKNCKDAYGFEYHKLWLDNIIKTGDIFSLNKQERLSSITSAFFPPSCFKHI